MYFEEFRVALAHAVALNRTATHDVAMLWQGDALAAIQSAPKVAPLDSSLATPIVRMLRNRGERLERGFTISTTAPPTEACLGMARMCGVHNILHLSGGRIRKITCKRSGTSSELITPSFKGPVANVTKLDSNRRRNDVAWYTAPATHAATLKDWMAYVSGARSDAGGMAYAAANTGITLTGPVPSTFPDGGLEFLSLNLILGDQEVVDNVMMMLAFEMVAQVSGYTTSDKRTVSQTVGPRGVSFKGQNIGSLLTDSESNILGWGFNTNKENSTRHGEVNLISNFLAANPKERLPDGGTIYTTLEPCEMCSGFIARAVLPGYKFRVIYGQKDEHVQSTALQRNANPGIVMSASNAALATNAMINSGSGVGATNRLVEAMAQQKSDAGIIETTKFLKTKATYESFFGKARPNWWLYMWDHLASRIPAQDLTAKEKDLMKHPMVARMNSDLDAVYDRVESFMRIARSHGATD